MQADLGTSGNPTLLHLLRSAAGSVLLLEIYSCRSLFAGELSVAGLEHDRHYPGRCTPMAS
jgi:hypothetical protein